MGILSNGARNDADTTLSLVDEQINGDLDIMKCAAYSGLGTTYAGSARENVMELLLLVIEQERSGPATILEECLAGLVLG